MGTAIQAEGQECRGSEAEGQQARESDGGGEKAGDESEGYAGNADGSGYD